MAERVDQKPVAGSTGILIDSAGDVGSFVLCRIESECRSVVRKRKVIVDSLGDMDVADRIVLCLEEFGDPVGCRCSVITSDGHQELDVVVLEEGEVEIILEIIISGLETAHLEVGTTPVEIGISLEEVDVFSVKVVENAFSDNDGSVRDAEELPLQDG